MNKLNLEKFNNGDFSVNIKYISGGNTGDITFLMDHLETTPASDFKKILNIVLLSDDPTGIFETFADFLDFCKNQDFFKADKISALKKILDGYMQPKSTEKATPAGKLAKKFFTTFKKAAIPFYARKDGFIYLSDSYIGIKVPETVAGDYIDFIEETGKCKTFNHLEGFGRFGRDCVVTFKSSFVDTRGGKNITVDYFSNKKTASDVLINSKYTKLLKGLDVIFYAYEGSKASKSPVYFESTEKDKNGNPVFSGIMCGLYINDTAETKINELKRLDTSAKIENLPTAKELKATKETKTVKETEEKHTITEYNGYYIEYNLYKKNEFSVQIEGDDVIFETFEAAKKCIDGLNGNETAPENPVDPITPDNYKSAALLLFSKNQTNFNIIMSAGIESGVIDYAAFMEYITAGKVPNFHTFTAWKEHGYTVKKGEKARFNAYIWKNKPVKICKDGETIESDKYFKKLSYFFGADQVEKMEV